MRIESNFKKEQIFDKLKKETSLPDNYQIRHLEFISPSGVKVVLVRELIEKNLWCVYGEVILPVFCNLYAYVDSIKEGFEEGLENLSVSVIKTKFSEIVKINLPFKIKGQLLDDDFYFEDEEMNIISKIANTIAIVDCCLESGNKL